MGEAAQARSGSAGFRAPAHGPDRVQPHPPARRPRSRTGCRPAPPARPGWSRPAPRTGRPARSGPASGAAARRPPDPGLHRGLEPTPLVLEGVPAGGLVALAVNRSGSRCAVLPARPRAPGRPAGAAWPGEPAWSLATVRSRTAAGARHRGGGRRAGPAAPARRRGRSRRRAIRWPRASARAHRARRARGAGGDGGPGAPRASACRARASQATLRVSGGLRRRDRAAARGAGPRPAPAPGQRDLPGQQVSWQPSLARAASRLRGDLLGGPEQARRTLTGRVPGLGQDEARPGRPDVPALGPEQLVGPARPRAGGGRGHPRPGRRWPPRTRARPSCRGSRRRGASGPARRRSPGPLRRRAGRQQGPAAVDGEVGIGLRPARRSVSPLRRSRPAPAEGRRRSAPPVRGLPGPGVLKVLPAGREQLFGAGVVGRRAPGEAEGQRGFGPPVQRPRLPDRVAGPTR